MEFAKLAASTFQILLISLRRAST